MTLPPLLPLLQTAASDAHPLAGTAAEWVWLLPALAVLGFLVNGALALLPAARGAHDVRPAPYAGVVSIVGPAVIAAAFAVAVAIFAALRGAPPDAAPFVQRYGAWMPAGDLRVDWAFQVDQLSVLMALVITGVGTLIHVFSVGYMRRDPGYARYFAYLNLFVAFMLVLVLGASYPVLFVGWEGVGLASYLLIGFWFTEAQNAAAGKKAFVVNRIGDFGFLVAMFLMFANFGALDFAGVNARAAALLPAGSAVATAICLFTFLGCAGKSAQIPLYVWLPDAMAGPTPVSALIHAATMVTAGVYLVARSGVLFALSPVASLVVALVGALTALFAATIGLKQWDIKKVLAYSTISQLGYMFMAAGVGAYSAAVFHLVTHAFFKALLFLGAGSVIYALHEAYHATHRDAQDAQDMRNMGGLRRHMPATFALMWVATLAISGVPPFAGFFSKDQILGAVFERAHGSALADARVLGVPGSAWLYVVYGVGLLTALLTAVYMTRLMLYTFHGANRTGEGERAHLREAPAVMTAPLAVLGALTVAGGWLNLPALIPLGPVGLLDRWLEPTTGGLLARHGVAPLAGEQHPAFSTEVALVGAAVAVAALGIAIAVLRLRPAALAPKDEYAVPESGVERTLRRAYYVDEGLERGVARPLALFSRVVLWRGVDVGLIDGLFVRGAGLAARGLAWAGSRAQTGRVGNYAWVVAVGAIVVIGAVALR